MSARDELIELVLPILDKCFDSDWNMTYSEMVTDAILAAGYTKPRTVTTREEVDGLSTSATILDGAEVVWVNDGDVEDPWASVVESPNDGPVWTSSAYLTLPATVLYEPTA